MASLVRCNWLHDVIMDHHGANGLRDWAVFKEESHSPSIVCSLTGVCLCQKKLRGKLITKGFNLVSLIKLVHWLDQRSWATSSAFSFHCPPIFCSMELHSEYQALHELHLVLNTFCWGTMYSNIRSNSLLKWSTSQTLQFSELVCVIVGYYHLTLTSIHPPLNSQTLRLMGCKRPSERCHPRNTCLLGRD